MSNTAMGSPRMLDPSFTDTVNADLLRLHEAQTLDAAVLCTEIEAFWGENVDALNKWNGFVEDEYVPAE